MVGLAAALRSDLRRPWLWKGSAISAALALGLLGILLVAGTDGAGAETPGMSTALLEPLASLVLTVSAVFGSLSFTAD